MAVPSTPSPFAPALLTVAQVGIAAGAGNIIFASAVLLARSPSPVICSVGLGVACIASLVIFTTTALLSSVDIKRLRDLLNCCVLMMWVPVFSSWICETSYWHFGATGVWLAALVLIPVAAITSISWCMEVVGGKCYYPLRKRGKGFCALVALLLWFGSVLQIVCLSVGWDTLQAFDALDLFARSIIYWQARLGKFATMVLGTFVMCPTSVAMALFARFAASKFRASCVVRKPDYTWSVRCCLPYVTVLLIFIVLAHDSLVGYPSAFRPLYDKTDMLCWASNRGDLDDVKALLGQGARINGRSRFSGHTPLHDAAINGDVEIAEYLIHMGADVDTRTRRTRVTALHLAAQAGNRFIVDLLMKRGADPNARSSAGSTPLHEAARKGHRHIAEALIGNGADVNAEDCIGTPLYVAAYIGHRDVVQLLVSKGANVNMKGWGGTTPLHEAVRNGRRDVTELLVACGAEINPKDRDGETPLDIAAKRDDRGIAALLRQHGGKSGK